jgi:uncharacterized protein YjbI with pentapeptide repeats
MANAEQLAILKQGIEVWNHWRIKNYSVNIELKRAELIGTDLNGARLSRAYLNKANLQDAELVGADLRGADLTEAHLSGANLRNANLERANLRRADLKGSSLRGVNLREANLSEANLSESNLRKADLLRANLVGANLVGASLSETHLLGVNFLEADLSRANLAKSTIGLTIFANNDLSSSLGLEKIIHASPSTMGMDTIRKSKGKIPIEFLRGCGLSDWEIEEVKLYSPGLSNEEINRILYKMYDLRATQALQISPLFISYSHANGEFANKIGDSLTKKGIRYWRDIHDMKSGRMEKQIDRAIHQNPTVLLVLSEHSLSSDWVEHEVRMARGLEKEMGRDVLCPVALDDSWKDSRWPKRVMEQIMEYNILDFSAWEDDSKFGNTFNKLIDGLELFYKG